MSFKSKPVYRGNRNSFKIHVKKDDVVQVAQQYVELGTDDDCEACKL
jgi:hypothetical protein